MDGTWSIGSNRREKVLRLEVVRNFIKLFTVSREEDATSPWSITHSNNITLYELGTVSRRGEGLVKSAMARGNVCNGSLVKSLRLLSINLI